MTKLFQVIETTRTEELKAARKAKKAEKQAAKWARATQVPEWTRDIAFAPACSPAEFYAPLPTSAQVLRAKINR